MSRPKRTKGEAALERASSLLHWLMCMCARDPATEMLLDQPNRAATVLDLLGDRKAAWLPIDRGLGPRHRELDSLLAGGYAERSNPIPTVLRLRSSRVECF